MYANDGNTPAPETRHTSRIAMAKADLQAAEAADLGNATNAELVLLLERIRGSLADMIRIASGTDR